MTLPLDLAESLAVAACSADLYHHVACQILDTDLDEHGREIPAVCTCGFPEVLQGLSAALGVNGLLRPLEELWAHVEARLGEPALTL